MANANVVGVEGKLVAFVVASLSITRQGRKPCSVRLCVVWCMCAMVWCGVVWCVTLTDTTCAGGDLGDTSCAGCDLATEAAVACAANILQTI